MAKIKLMTPVVAVADNMKDAKAIKADGLVEGKIRLGLLDNTKPNAGLLLNRVAELLKAKGIVNSSIAFDKHDRPKNPASSPASDAALAQLSTDCDFVLAALGN